MRTQLLSHPAPPHEVPRESLPHAPDGNPMSGTGYSGYDVPPVSKQVTDNPQA